jgi:hypothetical protein
MEKEPVMNVQWNGRETVPIISQMIAYAGRIELRLAPEFNHALFQKLHPEAPHSVVESLDRSGDAELLNVVSEVDGLHDIALLVDILRAEDAWVQIVSPPHDHRRDTGGAAGCCLIRSQEPNGASSAMFRKLLRTYREIARAPAGRRFHRYHQRRKGRAGRWHVALVSCLILNAHISEALSGQLLGALAQA